LPDYRYITEFTTVYPDELTENGSLVATFGLDHEWAEAPADGRWALTEDAQWAQPRQPAPPADPPEVTPTGDPAVTNPVNEPGLD
jgi:hypothetical protein